MTETNGTEDTGTGAPGRKPLLAKARLTAGATALGGMIVGAIVGIGVQVGVESTGLLGPSVEALMSEQEASFVDLKQRLADMRSASPDPAVSAGLAEIAQLIERQDELRQHANAELGYLTDQVKALKEQQLAEAGFTGGADFWLGRGESVNIGGPDHVFGLLNNFRNVADINLDGAKQRVSVGDMIPVSDVNCAIFYKQATPRSDGRVGFDLDCG